jgi:hypothetical protein
MVEIDNKDTSESLVLYNADGSVCVSMEAKFIYPKFRYYYYGPDGREFGHTDVREDLTDIFVCDSKTYLLSISTDACTARWEAIHPSPNLCAGTSPSPSCSGLLQRDAGTDK